MTIGMSKWQRRTTQASKSVLCWAWMLLGMSALSPLSVSAQTTDLPANDLADRIIRAYSQLATYCDRGKRISDDYAIQYQRTFEHCIRQDGSYRVLYGSGADPDGVDVRWTDTRRYHWYYGGRDGTGEYSRATEISTQRPNKVPPILAAVLQWYSILVFDMSSLEKRLGEFQVRPELSNDLLLAYESTDPQPDRRQRVWISRADGMIRRVSGDVRLRGLEIVERGLEITEIRVNEPIPDANLEYGLSIGTRVRCAAASNMALIVYTICIVSCLVWLVYRRAASRLSPMIAVASGTTVEPAANTQWTIRQWLGLPSIATLVGSTVAFIPVIAITDRYTNGEWSGTAYKEYEWPAWIANRHELWVIGPLYANTIVAVLCIVGLCGIVAWLQRCTSWRIKLVFCLLACLFSAGLLAFNREASSGVVYGAPFDWMFWHKFFKTWSKPLWSAVFANALVGLFLAGCVMLVVERSIKGKLRWPALSAMAIAAYIAYGLVTQHHGGGYEGWRGLPFTWYWWMDLGGGHTRYSALYADLAIALVYVAAMTLTTEWIHRLQNKTVTASTLIVSAGLSVVLLRWHTSLHYEGDFGYREYYGALFYWKAPFDDSFWRVDSWPSFLGNVAAAFTVVMLLSFVVHAFIKRRRTIAVTERSSI